MCPICLTSLAITVATTTGAAASMTAFALRLTRSFTQAPEPETPGDDHEASEERCDP
jgi:hypothetical protein